MFIFYFLGVGLPCRSIFCQFWLCEEVKCVYLRRHLGSPSLLPYFLWVLSTQLCVQKLLVMTYLVCMSGM